MTAAAGSIVEPLVRAEVLQRLSSRFDFIEKVEAINADNNAMRIGRRNMSHGALDVRWRVRAVASVQERVRRRYAASNPL
jgi:hypothetical protein